MRNASNDSFHPHSLVTYQPRIKCWKLRISDNLTQSLHKIFAFMCIAMRFIVTSCLCMYVCLSRWSDEPNSPTVEIRITNSNWYDIRQGTFRVHRSALNTSFRVQKIWQEFRNCSMFISQRPEYNRCSNVSVKHPCGWAG